MPAEWHPHSACWMAWPASEETFSKAPLDPAKAFSDAKRCYGMIAQTIVRFEPVFMLANQQDISDARELCGSQVTIVDADIDDGWFRDSGPTFLIHKTGKIAGVNWRFNGWGHRAPYGKDNLIASDLLAKLEVKRFDAPFVLEGGGIHVDGQGTLLATESSVLNQNRNPNLSKSQVEDYLCEYLNVSKIVWLNGTRAQSETDGHVDGLACFIRPGVVLTSVGSDAGHPDYETLLENREILLNSKDAKGRRIEVVEIREPYEYLADGTLIKGIYANFYIANGGIILPEFDFPEFDRAALDTLKREFPNYEIVQLPTRILLFGGGNIHCITQQQPAVAE